MFDTIWIDETDTNTTTDYSYDSDDTNAYYYATTPAIAGMWEQVNKWSLRQKIGNYLRSIICKILSKVFDL